MHKDNGTTEARGVPSNLEGACLVKGQLDFPGVHGQGHSRRGDGLNAGTTSRSILEPSTCHSGQGEVEGEDGKSEFRQGCEGP